MLNAQEIESAILNLQKAISTTPVTGLLLVREDLQSELALMAPTDTPLRNRLNRIQGNGKAHAWYQLKPTVQPEGLFLGTAPSGGFFPRGGLPAHSNASYVYKSAPYTSLGDVVEVAFFDQMAGATYTDVKKLQIKIKMINVALMEEWAIINGDSSVGAGLQFDGITVQTTSNLLDNGGVPISLNGITRVEKNIALVGGKPQAIVMSYRDQLKFNELVLGSFYRLFQAGAGMLADVPSGVNITRWTSPFGVVDVIGSRYIVPNIGGQTFALVIDDKTVLNDGNAIQMVDLMPISAIDLALLQTAYRTIVAEFSVLQMTCEAFQGKLFNIIDPTNP